MPFALVGATRDAYVSPVRRAPFFAVVATLAACGGGSRDEGQTERKITAGPDPIVVRVPRAGGVVRASRFAELDSVVWRSTQAAPVVDRILGFDPENGMLAFVDSAGGPGWIDLRLGSIKRPSKGSYASLASADGWSIFGLTASGGVVRMTPSGDWTLPGERVVRRVVPTPDGTVLLLVDAGEEGALLLRTRPPDDVITDSLDIPRTDRAVVTPVGDRVYLGAADRLLTVPPNDISRLERFSVDDDILAIAPTPSGDRVFVASQGSPRLERLDRYSGDVSGSVKLPGLATELRMDPLGRYLLARPVEGDSVWVVAVGTEELVATLKTGWRADLPAVAVDGTVATLQSPAVDFVDPVSGESTRRVATGAQDLWFFARWNGFRPRARGIDVPVAFRTRAESTRVVSGGQATNAAPSETAAADRPATPSTERQDEPPPAPAQTKRSGWTLSFAAVLSMDRAREIASSISVDGQKPRVSPGESGGTPVYRVIMGPFPTRDDAERAGKASKQSFWVYEGVP